MKKNWLGGLLLGVSLALLLGGGVALAQAILIKVTPERCVECFTDFLNRTCMGVSSSGWQDNEAISFEAWHDGYNPSCPSCGHAVNGVFAEPLFFCPPCPGAEPPPPPVPPASAFDVGAQNLDPLGEWRFRLSGDTSGFYGEFTILVAEDCAAAMFVPEPGSILLLGSGLAGLAGYAALRLRSGQALRWRSRE